MRKPFHRKQNNSWYFWLGDKQVRLFIGDKTPANAKRAEREWHERRVAAEVDAPDAPVDAIVNAFLDMCIRHKAEATTAQYAHYLVPFCKRFGTMQYKNLKRHHVTKWLDDKWPTSGSRFHAIKSLKACFNWGVSEELIAGNPVAKLKQPTMERRDVLLSYADTLRIMRQSDRPFRRFLKAMIKTGCRPGEIAKLTAENVDLGSGCWIFKVRQHKTGKATERKRVVYLNHSMLRLTRKLVAMNPEGPIFRAKYTNRPWNRNAIRCRFRRLREKYELPGVVAYSLRHSYITRALEKGESDATVAELTGTSTDMIRRHYGHLNQMSAHLKDAASRIARPKNAGSRNGQGQSSRSSDQ